jgi:predicted aspartyl protease
VTIRPAGEPPAPGAEPYPSAALALEFIHRGEFSRAERTLAELPLDSSTRVMAVQGMLDLYHHRLGIAETELRQVFDSGSDTAVRRLAYRGLESIYTAGENYPALESLENHALTQGLLTDTTDLVSARVLNRIGPTRVEPSRARTDLRISYSISNSPVLPVRVNGRGPGSFWFDTGASLTTVSDALARRMHVRIFAQDSGYVVAAARCRVPMHFGVIDSLRIDSLVVRNVPVAVMPRSDLSLGVPGFYIDGILGWSLISLFRTTIDYPGRRMSFEYPAPEDSSAPDMFFFSGVPLVRVEVDTTAPLHFIFDTGAQAAILQQTGLARLGPKTKLVSGPGCIGGAGGGGFRQIQAVSAARIAVGGSSIYPVSLPIYTLPIEDLSVAIDGLLGENILHNFVVTIDAPNGVLTLK